MKTFEKIVTLSEKGQITLPVAWRARIGTTLVRITAGKGETIEIAPIKAVQDDASGWVSIFEPNEKRPTVEELLRVLKGGKKGRPKSKK